jgi:hypothetical protein
VRRMGNQSGLGGEQILEEAGHTSPSACCNSMACLAARRAFHSTSAIELNPWLAAYHLAGQTSPNSVPAPADSPLKKLW